MNYYYYSYSLLIVLSLDFVSLVCNPQNCVLEICRILESFHTFAFKNNSLKHNASHTATEAQTEIINDFPIGYLYLFIRNLICNLLLSYGACVL